MVLGALEMEALIRWTVHLNSHTNFKLIHAADFAEWRQLLNA
jgi:hypothetical protein